MACAVGRMAWVGGRMAWAVGRMAGGGVGGRCGRRRVGPCGAPVGNRAYAFAEDFLMLSDRARGRMPA